MVIHETKTLCAAKKTINKMTKQIIEWEKTLVNRISDNGLIFKLYIRNSYNPIARKPTKEPDQKMGKKLERHFFFPEKTYKWPTGM